MEDCQKKQNEYLTIDEFNKLHFGGPTGEMPVFIMDLIVTLTGVAREFLGKVLT
jgi:hypothetical protein